MNQPPTDDPVTPGKTPNEHEGATDDDSIKKNGDKKSTNPPPGDTPDVPDGTPSFQEVKDDFERRKEQSEQNSFDLTLRVLPPRTRLRNAKTFVPPNEGFTNFLDKAEKLVETDRIFVIAGTENSWNWTCALKLGEKLAELENDALHDTTDIVYYMPGDRKRWSLLEIADHKNVGQRPLVCVVKSAFEEGIDREELSTQTCEALTAELRTKKLFLVLTTGLSNDSLSALSAPVVSSTPGSPDFRTLLDRHLEYYNCEDPIIEAAGNAADELLGIVGGFDLDRIDALAKQLRAETDLADPDENRQMVVKTASSLKRVRRSRLQLNWFAQLSKNVQLYAMLAFLFEGIESATLDEIYIRSVILLRESGIENLKDPRENGFDDILAHLGCQPWANSFVEFSDQALRDQLKEQIRNFRYLLWDLLKSLLELVEEYKAPQYWAFRRKLGGAIGRIAVGFNEYETRVDGILEKLLSNSSGGVVSVCGYAFEQVCAAPDGWKYASGRLRHWILSGDPQKMWAAGLAIWRIYSGIGSSVGERNTHIAEQDSRREDLEKLIESLAGNLGNFNTETRLAAYLESRAKDDNASEENVKSGMLEILTKLAARNFDAVVNATVHMAEEKPDRMALLLERWLMEENDNNLHPIASIALTTIFESYRRRNIGPALSDESELAALVRVAMLTDFHTLKVMLEAFENWMRHPTWRVRVHRTVLATVNRSDNSARRRLVLALHDTWLQKADRNAVQVARAIAARATLLCGKPILPTRIGTGSILLDCSNEAEFQGVLRRIASCLFERLGVQAKVNFFRMGESDPIQTVDGYLSAEKMASRTSPPPLCLPILENEADKAPAFSVILLHDPKRSDIVDASCLGWQERLVVGRIPSSKPDEEEDSCIPGRESNPDVLIGGDHQDYIDAVTEISRRIDARIRIALENAPLARIQDDSPSPDFIKHFNKNAEAMDDIETSNHPGDLVGKIFEDIITHSASNLQNCINLARGWIEDENRAKRVLGLACTSLLFARHDGPTGNQSVRKQLAELFGPLARHGGDGIMMVVSILQRWAKDSPDPPLFLSSIDDDRRILRRFIGGLDESGTRYLVDKVSAWKNPDKCDISLADKLFGLVSRIPHRPIPTLEKGRVYCLLAVDATSPLQFGRKRIESLLNTLIASTGSSFPDQCQIALGCLGSDKITIVTPGDEKVFSSIPRPRYSLPPLIGPLLSRFGDNSLGTVVIIANRHLLDWEDCIHSELRDLICLYAEGGQERAQHSQSYSNKLREIPVSDEDDKAASHIVREISSTLRK